MRLKKISLLFSVLLGVILSAQSQNEWLSQYNVSWDKQSESSWQSMPCGGGSLGLNVWVESNNLYILMASPDSWTTLYSDFPNWINDKKAINRLLVKLGRLKLKFSDDIFAKSFKQELDLSTNSINVTGFNNRGEKTEIKIWVSVDEPVFYIDGKSDTPIEVEAALEIWKGKAAFKEESVFWCQSNNSTEIDARKYYMQCRNLEAIADSIPNPISDLIFGGVLSGKGFVKGEEHNSDYQTIPCQSYSIKTKKVVKQFDIQATMHIKQDKDVTVWEKELKAKERLLSKKKAQSWENVKKEWTNRWSNSYIRINETKGEDDLGWQVGRNYQLFRAMLAANSKGTYPTLFNGGLFICSPDPDERKWHWSEFMGQNQRLVYWPMLKSGDKDLLDIALNFYKDRTNVNRAWAKHFWNIDKGHLYVEDMNVFGLPCYMNTPQGHSEPDCLSYHYISGMEFALMMLEQSRYVGSDINPYIPSIIGILEGFDAFYRKKSKERTGEEFTQTGYYDFYPTNGAELYTECRNDAATLSGLIALSDGLLALEKGKLSESQVSFLNMFRSRIPRVPLRVIRDHITVSPAESWVKERADTNMELPQLYSVFPFYIYGIGKPDLKVAIDTWKYGYYKKEYQHRTFCWYQGNIFTARLGLTEEAKEYAISKFLYPTREKTETKEELEKATGWDKNLKPQRTRFPAFWDTGDFCQAPDFDHGGSAMVGLQEMLMQTELPAFGNDEKEYGRKIYLLPAWPRDWDVSFRLHAPYQTIVECEVKDGKIIKLNVTPKEREKDIVCTGTFFESKQ